MKEFNKETLQHALKKLPDAAPSPTDWLEIGQKMNDLPLKQALNTLPDFVAPEFNMEKKAAIIEQDLPQSFRLPKLPILTWRMAAAVLLFALSYYFIADKLLTRNSPDLHEEVVEVYEIPESSTNEEFSEIMQLCEAEAWVCEKPGFTDLKIDYQELDNAQSELVNAMQDYGENLNLIKQFNDIERRKALILNDLSLFI